MKYQVTPVAKPRQTRSDKWKQRPAVMKYRAFCDQCRLLGIEVPESGAHVTFHIPMPKSWSKKRRAEMLGQPHQQRPDTDNLAKALLDAVLPEDSGVWDIRTTKRWAETGSIEIKDQE